MTRPYNAASALLLSAAVFTCSSVGYAAGAKPKKPPVDTAHTIDSTAAVRSGGVVEKPLVIRRPAPEVVVDDSKYSAYTLVAGVSAGPLIAGTLDHPHLDFWLGARLDFLDIGIFLGTAAIDLSNIDLVTTWLDRDPETKELEETKASGLSLGGQLGLHHWLGGWPGVAPRIGLMGRAGRAGFERSISGDRQTISLNGYAAELFATFGLGNHDGMPSSERWLIFLSFGYAVAAVNSVATPNGSYAISSDTHGYFLGLGFEGGFNVPVTN